MKKTDMLNTMLVAWGLDKGIFHEIDEGFGGNTVAQLKKTAEEVLEATEAFTEWSKSVVYNTQVEALEGFKKEMGDIYVTWLMGCMCANVDPEECIEKAYEKIKTRTGKMVNGQFVKSDEGC